MATGMFRTGTGGDNTRTTGGVTVTIEPGVGLPSDVDYGTIPSDLIRDELLESSFVRDFLTKFKDKLEGKTEAAVQWIEALGKYGTGDAELSDLEGIDVSGLMDVEGFEDYYYSVVPRPLTEDQIEDGINVSDLIKTHGQEAVDAIFDKAGEAVDIIKKTAKDPQAAIDSFIGTFGKNTKTGTWKDWTDVGIWGGILGIPLPPGFMGKSVRDIEDGLKKIGKTINDLITKPAETIGELVTEAKDAITGVFTKGADPAGIYDFVSGIFGGAVSGIIMGEIGDTLDSLLLGEADDEEETEEVLFEGFEPDRETIVDPAEVDLSGLEDGDEDDVVPGFVLQDPDRETIVDPAQDDEVKGFQYATPCDNPQYAEANPEECGVNTVITGGDDNKDDDQIITGDEKKCEDPEALNTGEEGDCKYPPKTEVDEGPDQQYSCDDPNATTRPDGSCGPCKAGYVFDGAVERCVQEEIKVTGTTTTTTTTPPPPPPPPETAPPPETGGGGGGGGGSGMMTQQIDPFVFDIAGDPQLLAKLEFPVVDYLAQILPADVQQNVMKGLFEGMV